MRLTHRDLDQFHSHNVCVPTRTIYYCSEGEVAGCENGVDYASTKKLITNLYFLNNVNHRQITVVMNQPGGDEFQGFAVYDVIQRISAPVKIICVGQAMSMGTIILQSATRRWITANTTFMIHDGTFAVEGEAKSAEAWAQWSKDIRERMYRIYYRRIKEKHSRFTLAEVEELCNHDTILSAEQAVKLGLADKVV